MTHGASRGYMDRSVCGAYASMTSRIPSLLPASGRPWLAAALVGVGLLGCVAQTAPVGAIDEATGTTTGDAATSSDLVTNSGSGSAGARTTGGAQTSTGAGEQPEDAETGTTGEPIEPTEPPFGGWVRFNIQGSFPGASARFYEIPSDPDYVPAGAEVPYAGPRTEDNSFMIIGGVSIPPQVPPPAEFTEGSTIIEVGQTIELINGAQTMTMTFDPEQERWSSDPNLGPDDIATPTTTWSLGMPGNGELPEEVIEVAPLDSVEISDFALTRDDNGVPRSINWTSSGEHELFFVALAIAEGGFGMGDYCVGDFAPDGQFDIPEQCFASAPEGTVGYNLIIGKRHVRDVEYAGHRIRATYAFSTTLELDYPFEAE